MILALLTGRGNSSLKNNGLQPWSFMGKKVLPYVIKNHHDIHNKFDLKLCELILKEKEY